MRSLHLDLSGGASGDMFLAVLAGLGVDFSPLAKALESAGCAVSIAPRAETRHGVAGYMADVEPVDPEGGQPLRHLPQILEIVRQLPFSDTVLKRAEAAFRRLAEAEAEVHGSTVDHVHFHEVGAVDTVADVVGCLWGLEALGVERVTATALPWFTGTVDCAHGRMPLPAPATARLMEGKPVRSFSEPAPEGELLTPTGAVLLDQIVATFDVGPQGVIAGMATGYGTKDLGHGLRGFLIEDAETSAYGNTGGTSGTATAIEQVWVLESNVDHLSGEDMGACFDALLQAGALDVLWLSGVMKKNRPGGMLQAICAPAHLDTVQEVFFASTLTLGLRRRLSERVALPRRGRTIATPWGQLVAKEARIGDRVYLHPEHDSLAALARKAGLTVAELRRELSMRGLTGCEK